MSSATVTKSQVTQKMLSAASVPTLSQMNINKYSAPISEKSGDGDEGENEDIDESREEHTTISNINSMDPVQWSNVKRDITD